MLREFGWSRSLLAGAFSVFVLVHGAAAPALGWLADRIGPRRLFVAGAAILALGLGLAGAVERPWHLYAAFGVVSAIGVACAGWVPAVVLVQRWFPTRVGAALGLTSAGIGVGILLVVPATQALVEWLGWRWAFRLAALAVLAWTVPMTLAVVRDPPGGPAGAGARLGGVTPREALGTPAFWLVCAASFLGSLGTQMLLVHQVAYLVDHGISALAAASVVSLVGLASIVGKTGGGWLSDTIGRRVTYTLGMACVVASVGVLGLLARTPGPLPAYAYGALVGVGYSVTAPLLPALVSDLFRGRHFGTIVGIVQVANSVGGAAGPWLGGRVFDLTGSYRDALLVAVATSVAATGALWLSARPGGQPPGGGRIAS
ncbi:MAG: hypothetical protein A2W08_13320 [Candidatus Rokubacteria bacterium RBG_16_73_20]|nr:MAG: hypothetical protein A2W08_13320 [Candidatus Rokubacteria bacterium RBG_16_73_20]